MGSLSTGGSIRKITKIIIHCSDSPFGNAMLIDEWHRARGWDCIGYHYVTLNGRPKTSDEYIEDLDGVIEEGRDIQKAGAHCKGQNKDSIGICLIGKDVFTDKQIRATVVRVSNLMTMYDIPLEEVYGHNHFNKGKTCPNIDMDEFRQAVKEFRERLSEHRG